MAKGPTVVRTVKDLRKRVVKWHAKGHRVALVPTMGALHAGHLSLVDQARKTAQRVVATIFVNPAQFGPNEDLSRYPRDEAGDLAMLRTHKTNLVFAPPIDEIYPPGFSTKVSVGGLDACLCGLTRPGHFDGVATVVTKLLNQAGADVAIFGEKDYQQLLIIKRLARDLDIGTEIRGGAIIREDDGLAMSSRNKYLTGQQRQMAPHLNATITAVAREIADGAPPADAAKEGGRVLAQAGFKVDYLEIRDGATLAPVKAKRPKGARVFAAGYLGQTRLIDNVPVPAK